MKRRVMTRLILVASLAYVGLTVLLPGTVPTSRDRTTTTQASGAWIH